MRIVLLCLLSLSLACGGTNATGPQPVTGQYTAANATTLFLAPGGYALSMNQQLAENGTWTESGTTLTMSALSSSAISTLTVGDGSLDGVIYGAQRHFTRIGP